MSGKPSFALHESAMCVASVNNSDVFPLKIPSFFLNTDCSVVRDGLATEFVVDRSRQLIVIEITTKVVISRKCQSFYCNWTVQTC